MNRSQELTETLSNLVAQHPFFATYLYTNMEIQEDFSIKSADTNGSVMRFNPKWFNKMPIKQRVFVLCHEILHGILEHPQRGYQYAQRGFGPDMKPWSHEIAGKSMDYIINAMLKEARIGEMPESGLWKPEITGDMLMDEVYTEMNSTTDDPDSENKDDKSSSGGGDEQQQGETEPSQPEQGDSDAEGSAPTPDKDHGGFDEHLDPAQGDEGMGEDEKKTAIAQATQAAEAMGKMPESLARQIGAIMEPELSWEELLRSHVTARAGMDTQTWRRPNRRRLAVAPHVYMPGRTGHQIGGMVLAIDVSGSINQDMLTSFFSECAGILSEVKAEWIKVVTVNTCVKQDFDIEEADELLELDIVGGGGTRLEKLATYMDEEDIDAEHVIFFTDGITRYSDSSPFPCEVTWVLTHDIRTPKYGNIVRMKK